MKGSYLFREGVVLKHKLKQSKLLENIQRSLVQLLNLLKRRVILDVAIMAFIVYLILFKQMFGAGLPAGTDSLGWVSRVVFLGKDFRWIYTWRLHTLGFFEHVSLLDFVFVSINFFFRDPSVTIKVFTFASFLLAEIAMYTFIYSYTQRRNAALISAVVYIFNPFLLNEFIEGHHELIFTYALPPLVFLALNRALKTLRAKDFILSALTLFVFVSTAHLQVIYILAYFLAFYLLFYFLTSLRVVKRADTWKRLLKVGTLCVIITFLSCSYLLIPYLSGAQASFVATSYGYAIDEAYANAKPHLGYIGFFTLFCLIPVSLATLYFHRNKYVVFFIISAFIGVFMAKGPYPPFENVWIWLFYNIPYMHVFRATTRWLVMTLVSFTFLTGVLAAGLETSLKGFRRPHVKLSDILKLSSRFILIGFVLVNASISASVFFRIIQTYSPPEHMLVPYEWIAGEPGDFRVATVGYFGYGSGYMYAPASSGGFHDIGYDSYYIHDKPVLQNGGWDTLAHDFFDFTLTSGRQKVDDLMELLGTFNVKYVVVPSYAPQDWREFFLKQRGTSLVLNYYDSLILQNLYWTQHLFAVSRYASVVGGREALTSLCKVDGFDLKSHALLYVDQNRRQTTLYDQLNNSHTLIFSQADVFDLAMLLMDDYVINAANYGYDSWDDWSHWIKSPASRDAGKLVISRLTLRTGGNNRVEIPFNTDSEGDHEIWIRLTFEPNRGNLTASIDGFSVGNIQPIATSFNLKWVKLGSISLSVGSHAIALTNYGPGCNDIDAIVVAKPSLIQSKLEEALSFVQSFQGRIVLINEAEDLFGQIPLLHLNGWDIYPSPFNASNGFVVRYKNTFGNVALQGKASASSLQGEGFEASRANDGYGIAYTRWASEKGTPQWLQIEWERPQELWKVRIVFEAAYAEAYQVQTWDGYDWINKTIVENNTTLEPEHVFDRPVTTTKLRLYFTSAPAFNSVSIWEVEAYSSSSFSIESSIPRSGSYMLGARLATGPSFGTIDFELGNISGFISCSNSTETKFKWYTIGPISLDIGKHPINMNWTGDVIIDEFLLYSLKEGENIPLGDLFRTSSTPTVTYERVNPCLYNAHVKSSEPFLLVFSDAYHPLWRVYVESFEIPPVIVYSFANGFLINKTGEFDIKLYFIGQVYTDVGLRVSVAVLTSVTVVLMIPSRMIKRLRSHVRWRKNQAFR